MEGKVCEKDPHLIDEGARDNIRKTCKVNIRNKWCGLRLATEPAHA
jgi:hypothetical protein